MKFKIQLILSTIVLSFLISFGSIAQTQSQKLGTNPTNIAPSAVFEIESTNKGVLFPRVALKSTTNGTDPIASPATGLTVFNTASAGTAPNNVTPGYYYWDGSKWVKMAIEVPPVDFAKTVYVNATSPSTATIFDENNPPATNDDALKSDDVNLYIGNNGSTWTFNTSTNTYNTFIVPAATPFNLAGTNTDAGNNKTGAIWRSGSIGIGINNPLTTLHVQNPLAATNSVNANAQVLRLSRPATGGVKNGNVAQFNLGSYSTGGSAFSRLDFALNDGGDLTTLNNIMTLQANGNVGIGITAPTQRLDVDGGSILVRRGNNAGQFGSNQILFGFSFQGNSTFQHAIKTRHDNGTSGNAIDFYTWSSALNSTNTTQVGLQHVMSLDGSGRVGIGGITAAQSVIDAASNSAATASVNASRKMLRLSIPTNLNTKVGNVAEFNMGSYAVDGTLAKSRLDLLLNDGLDNAVSQVMTWQANGNVGIGTTAPLTKLIVNDNAYIANIPTSSANLMDNSTFRPLTRFQTSSGANNNAISHYLTTTAAATQAHNYSTGTSLPYILQPAGGNVGIGIAAPSQRLHIKGTNAQPATTGTVSNATLRIDGSSSHALDIGTYTDAPYGSYLQSITTADLTTKLPLVLNPTGGNVGIGINNPAHKLSVLGNARIQPNSSNNGTGDLVWFEMYGKTSATSDTQVGGIKLGWYDLFGGIEIVRPSSSIGGLGLAFNYANSSGTTTEGFRLNNSGNVGIGTTSPTERLQVAGNIAATGTVSASGTTLTSDARLKSNIVNLNQGLSKIMQLNPVNYDKKEALDSAATVNENGFIAQELQKVLPELVSEGKDKDKLLSVNYTAIIPVLTKAVQEQQVIIEENKATIQKQQEQIDELKVLVEKLLDKK